ncbi:MAG: DUF3299 domain-containing protein [Planctomycetes bacterium]|nr:DUF3299 domain-containing protein [Planctomycetota bacterium]
MDENPNGTVADRQMSLILAEVGGREQAPDRLDAILRRARRGMEGANAGAGRQVGRLWAAALLLLGLSATIAVAVLAGRKDGAVAVGEATAAATGSASVACAVPVRGVDAQEPVPQEPVPKEPAEGSKANRRRPADAGDAGQGDGQSPPATGQQLPKGTDPADLAAMRSAEAMLAAEKKLQAMIAAGKIAGVDRVLQFGELGGWQYTKGLEGMPEKVRRLDGSKVLMLGFMLPIDEVEDIDEFLLVESLWSCCFGQPPDINGIVRCVMPKDKKLDYRFEPLKIVGRLKIAATELDGYCVDIYQLHVDYVEVLQ